MSLLSDYINEIDCGRRIIELPGVAFATYFIHRGANECYIEDLYISKPHRSSGVLSRLINQIAEVAIKNGCNKLTHGIVKTHKNQELVEKISRRIFGFKFHSETDTDKYFIKELDNE